MAAAAQPPAKLYDWLPALEGVVIPRRLGSSHPETTSSKNAECHVLP